MTLFTKDKNQEVYIYLEVKLLLIVVLNAKNAYLKYRRELYIIANIGSYGLTSSSRRVRVNPTPTCTGFLTSKQGLTSLLYSLKMSYKRRASPASSAFVKERNMQGTNPIIHVKFAKAISYVVTS